jgi:cellulose synthase operon protein YhjQ
MRERTPDPEQTPVPGDTATLYSRAHLRSNRYWDFSASRSEVRGQFGQRIVRQPVERGGAPHIAVVPPQPPGESEPAPPAVPIAEASAQPSVGSSPSRWYALHSVLASAEVPVSAPPASSLIGAEHGPPMVAVFSLAGGVGKTCLVATLGRALAALEEHVLLMDTAVCGLLPFYFGSHELKPGVIRTFSPPGAQSGAPVQVLNLEAEHYPGESGELDPLLHALPRDGRGVSRVLVDIATASRQVTNRLLSLRPTVLVPILPDMSSLASLGSLEAFLSRGALYVLNQFDASLPLHLDVREMLQQKLGDRLLPFVLRRSTAVSEALAEGMTVIDYAPNSEAAEDFRSLADWLRSFAAPAALAHAGARWSER